MSRKDSLVKEKEELDKRIEKETGFLNSDACRKVFPKYDIILLDYKIFCMKTYRKVIEEQIERSTAKGDIR